MDNKNKKRKIGAFIFRRVIQNTNCFITLTNIGDEWKISWSMSDSFFPFINTMFDDAVDDYLHSLASMIYAMSHSVIDEKFASDFARMYNDANTRIANKLNAVDEPLSKEEDDAVLREVIDAQQEVENVIKKALEEESQCSSTASAKEKDSPKQA